MDIPEDVKELSNIFDGSYWNTRILKIHVDGKYSNGEEYHEIYMGVFEVYYDKDDNPIAWSENPIRVSFNNKQDFGDVLIQILNANDRTILEVIDGNIIDTGILLEDLEDEEDE